MTDATETNDPNRGYSSNGEYLDDELEWLAVRAKRIGAEQDIRDSAVEPHAHRRVGQGRRVAADEGQRQLLELGDREARLRAQIDARLHVHRAAKSFPPLGLDRLVDEFKMSNNERLIVLLLTAPALSTKVTNELLEPIGLGSFSVDVDGITQLLEPATKGVDDYIRIRKLLRPDSSLVRNGLIALDFSSRTYLPKDLADTTVSLTAKALAVVTGDPSILSECPAGEL